tara:strand:- start:499 stop:702 length:204 start_codon:yes stop_codon:yes gene_type:complete
MKRMKVEGRSDLERDLYSNALVNTDSDAYNAFIQKVNEKNAREERLNRLEKDMSEIKDLIRQLIDKG